MDESTVQYCIRRGRDGRSDFGRIVREGRSKMDRCYFVGEKYIIWIITVWKGRCNYRDCTQSYSTTATAAEATAAEATAAEATACQATDHE